MTRLACALRSSPERRDESERLSREAITIARRLDDPESLSYALGGRFWATWWPENPEERTVIVSELADVAKKIGDQERIADTYAMLFMSLSERGLMADARREAANLSRYTKEIRQPALHWYGTVNLSELALIEGAFDRADELLTIEMGSAGLVTSARDDVSASRMQRFLLRREQGRVAEEEATVRASIDEFPWYPVHRAALVLLLMDQGRAPEARIIFDGLARDDFSAIYVDNEWLLGMGVAAEACSLLGDTAAAGVLYRRLEPFAGRHAIGHILGGTCNVPHGYTSCVMLPPVLRYNATVNADRQAWVSEALGRPGISAADAVAELVADLGLPGTLRAVGVNSEQLDRIAEESMHDRWVHTNPRKIAGPADVRVLLDAAW